MSNSPRDIVARVVRSGCRYLTCPVDSTTMQRSDAVCLLTGTSIRRTMALTQSPHVLPNGEYPSKEGVQKATFLFREAIGYIFEDGEVTGSFAAKIS